MKRIVIVSLVLAVVWLIVGAGEMNLGADQTSERVIKITAHKFAYEPNEIQLKVGEPVVLELTSKDVTHGFNLPDLGLRADLEPGETARVRLVPDKAGTFEFHCDNFCGFDHESMSATITVK
ncbi:MAG TPA: cupredoxin domain-containing protein [Candidatus Binatus sp.]|nr:cupredoxin domain-containing protein [Candidatus Binatus sp.]